MAWFLRAVEIKGGQWACRWGTLEYDEHDNLNEALAHLYELSSEFGTSVIFVHPVGAAIQRLNPYQPAGLPSPGPVSQPIPGQRREF